MIPVLDGPNQLVVLGDGLLGSVPPRVEPELQAAHLAPEVVQEVGEPLAPAPLADEVMELVVEVDEAPHVAAVAVLRQLTVDVLSTPGRNYGDVFTAEPAENAEFFWTG